MKWPAKRPAGLLIALGAALILALASAGESEFEFQEAPTGFDNLTNGLVDQATHDADRTQFFQEVDQASNGLGPVFNGTSCAGCHLNPVSGGGSTTTELRVGHTDSSGYFVNPTVVLGNGTSTVTGRSLINAFAICPDAQEQAPATETIHALRLSVNTLGDGFVEAIDDQTLLSLGRMQALLTHGAIHGQGIQVDVLEAPGVQRVGRFGWKDQQASLLSFAADAYLNEQGITNRLLPEDVTEVCESPDLHDPEDTAGADGLADIDHFARFVRATKAPPVDPVIASTADAKAGSLLFDAIGCNLCHVRTLKTAPAGTVINGGAFVVPDALGDKVIHPFGDFLLHNIGTGDGIVQNGGEQTAYTLRTTPLWGLRVRTRFMHDGQSLTVSDAIARHRGEASFVMRRYGLLTDTQKAQLLKFLSSL